MTTIAGPHQAASRLIDEGYAFAPPPADDRIEALRGLERAIRVFFHRQRTEQALAMAEELVRRTAEPRLEDPVRQWEPWMQTDRGLGRARRLHRLVNSLAWHGEPAAAGRSLQDAAADHLFVAVMNLVSRLPLSDEVHLFRLWYLASRAMRVPEKALRLFGDLRDLPPHQQIAAGARLLIASGASTSGTGQSHPRMQVR